MLRDELTRKLHSVIATRARAEEEREQLPVSESFSPASQYALPRPVAFRQILDSYRELRFFEKLVSVGRVPVDRLVRIELRLGLVRQWCKFPTADDFIANQLDQPCM